MKKNILSLALLLFASWTMAQEANNLIVKGDFKNLNTLATDLDNQLFRIASLTDTKTQATYPAATATDIVKGEWYKKASATGALICKVKENVQLADGTYGNAIQLKQTSGKSNQNQNCLTTYLNLAQEKEYILSFDIKPTEDIAQYAGLVYVYARALTADNKLGKSGIGTAVAADGFTEIANGWYRFSRKFSSAGFETENIFVNFAVNGSTGDGFLYDYMISNVSLVEAEATGLKEIENASAKVYAQENTIYVYAKEATAQVIDMTGRLIKSTDVNNQTAISVDQKGVYLVNVKSAEGQSTHKVIVK